MNCFDCHSSGYLLLRVNTHFVFFCAGASVDKRAPPPKEQCGLHLSQVSRRWEGVDQGVAWGPSGGGGSVERLKKKRLLAGSPPQLGVSGLNWFQPAIPFQRRKLQKSPIPKFKTLLGVVQSWAKGLFLLYPQLFKRTYSGREMPCVFLSALALLLIFAHYSLAINALPWTTPDKFGGSWGCRRSPKRENDDPKCQLIAWLNLKIILFESTTIILVESPKKFLKKTLKPCQIFVQAAWSWSLSPKKNDWLIPKI